MAAKDRAFYFHTAAHGDDPFEVVSFDGSEAISRLFRFDIELVSKKIDVDFDKILESPATLTIKQGINPADRTFQFLKIHGVVSSFELVSQGEWNHFRAVLVPAFWRMSLNVQSQIYMEKSVPEIIEEELKKAGFTSQDYEIKCKGKPQEYIVQYIESDLNFIQRLCEHHGISYYFKHEESAAKVVFTDKQGDFPAITGKANLPFQPLGAEGHASDLDWTYSDSVLSLSCRQHVIPKEVILQDYNWRTPTAKMKVNVPIDGKATFGTFYEFGNHYKDEGEGKDLATVRGQELKCRKKTYSGRSYAKAFRAGSKFKLEGHGRADFNQEYLLTELQHHAVQAIEYNREQITNSSYANDFVAIPGSETFRPERITPKPRVSGVFSATIDAGGSGQYAEIDDKGRYKVKIPFDLSDKGGGTASRYIRMAQPYSGGGMGMHFPLHKGTEVILIHTNGDPDRPIIVGSVPNPQTASPVTGGNQSQCKIHTGGGNTIEIEDTDGAQRITMVSPGAGTTIRMGMP